MVDQVTSVKQYIETLPQRFVASAAKGVKAIYQFELSGEGGTTYHVVIDDGTFQVVEGANASPSATIKMSAEDYVKMVNGKLSGTMAFMKGQMKVSGNVLLAQKLQSILPPAKG
jgi:putative sterol carrier protein